MDTLSNLEFTAVVEIFQISLGTSIKDVGRFLIIFNPPTYHVRQFLTYNVQYLGAFLDPLPKYPKIGRHLLMFPYSILDEWLTNFYFFGLFPIFRHPTQPWMHYITRLKQKCLQTCLCAIFSFQRISIILFERSSWDSAVYLE